MTMTMNPQTEVLEGVLLDSIPDAIVANARELDDLRTASKTIKEREEVLRAAILNYLAGAEVDAAVTADGTVAISRSTHARNGIDRAKMEALFPSVLKAVTTSTPVVQVRVKIKG